MITNTVDFNSEPIYKQAANHLPSHQLKLRVWAPEGGENDRKEIAIILHGFLEGVDNNPKKNEQLIKLRYQKLAESLAENGITSVFLPIPFHFERAEGLKFDGNTPPAIQKLKTNPEFLFFGGYDQLKVDVGLLIQDIKTFPQKYGISEAIKIHLVGYSLGGAAAMACAADLPKGSEADTLAILFSTWGLSSLDSEAVGQAFGRFGFNAEDWEEAINVLGNRKDQFDEGFRELVWGEGSPDWFKRFPKRVLFVHGLKDEIFVPQKTMDGNIKFLNHLHSWIESLPEEEQGEFDCTFINPNLGHFSLFHWGQIGRYVSNFIRGRN